MSEAVAPPTSHVQARPRRLLGDDRLSRLAADGDRRAFATIYRRYHQEIYRYCLAILRNPEDARDALQNTMMKALGSLPGEQRQIALKPWLYRVAHNEAVTVLRQRPQLSPLEEATEPQGPSANQQAEDRIRLRELVSDLGSLPDRQRGALVMRELSGLSYSEIGSSFETSSAAAKQTVYEARAALHEIAGGREMGCEGVRGALSANDGRVLRGRKLRAHLRSCAECRSFRVAIERRRSDLAALAPPLPALAATAMLQGLVGGKGGALGGGASSLLGAGAVNTAGSGAVLKVAAAVVATAAVGVGTAEVTGVVQAPFVGSSGSSAPPLATPGQSSHNTDANQSAAGSAKDKGGSGPTALNQNGGRSGQAAKSAGQGKSHAAATNSGQSTKAHGKSALTHGASVSNGNGPPSGAGGGRSFGQQQAQSHAPQPPAQAHPAPKAPAAGNAAAKKGDSPPKTSAGVVQGPAVAAHPAHAPG